MPYLNEVFHTTGDQYDIIHKYETTRNSGLVVIRQLARTTIFDTSPVALSDESRLVLPPVRSLELAPVPDGLPPAEQVPSDTLDQFRDIAVDRIYTIYQSLTRAVVRLEIGHDLAYGEQEAVDGIITQMDRIANGVAPNTHSSSTGFYL